MVWPLPQGYIFLTFMSGWSHLTCELGVVPDFASSQAVFCVSGKVRMRWGLLSGLTVWRNEFQD